MTEIIRNWLLNSVGCNMLLTPETLGEVCFDGKLFAQILATYNICSYEYMKAIEKTVDPKVALLNLRKLCIWFKLLGISVNDKLLEEIIEKKGSACLRLLYELYVRLENRENMIYMDSKKRNRILTQSSLKFSVSKAPEVIPEIDLVDEKQYLLDILNSLKGMIQNTHKEKLQLFLKTGLQNKVDEIQKQILQEFKINPTATIGTDKNLEVQAKINEFEDLNILAGESSQQYICSPDKYIGLLKVKKNKLEADKKLKQKMEKNVMQDAWKKILCEQDKELKNILSSKLLKQAEYEKQMAFRLQRIRLKYRKCIDNRKMIMDVVEKQDMVNDFRNSFHSIKNEEITIVEKQRINELHKRLFNEKMKVKRCKNELTCRKILEDIVDYAMIMQDYLESNGTEMPRKKVIEWKYLLMRGVELLPPFIKKPKLEEDIILLDDDRITELAESDFLFYHYLVGPWFFNKSLEEADKMAITGFIVHRLLNLKYDFKLATGEPAGLPNYDYKIFVHRINDTMALEKIKYYLSKFKIFVFDIYTVINYFLNAFKVYSGIDTLKEITKNLSPVKKKRGSPLSSPTPTSDKSPKSDKIYFGPSNAKDKLDKSVQCPSIYEMNKDLAYLNSIRLGRFTSQILQEGGLLPDALVCTMIIEYLKTLKDINGWVLLNYPENITQIAILEFLFTGLEVPFMPLITSNIRKLIEGQMPNIAEKDESVEPSSPDLQMHDEEQLELRPEYSFEELVKLQNSNILPQIKKKKNPPIFHSYFSKVIVLQREDAPKKKKGNRQISPTKVEEDETVTLEKFFDALEISSYFPYKNFDFVTLKKLLRFVLSTSSNKDQEVLKNFSFTKPGDQNIIKPKEFEKQKVDPWLLNKRMEPDWEKGEDSSEDNIEEEEVLIYPGHADWEYTELPIPEKYCNVLATVWESIEYYYTRNLIDCFGLMRSIQRRLMPYRNYIRRKASECLGVDDDRTQAVTNFQLMINNFDDHYRSMDTMKNEFHCRVFKLQCDLWKMTDVKKFYCEQVLSLLKNQNWISSHLVNLLKVYMLIYQIEINRYADTMQLIEDYYSICLLGSTAFGERLSKMSMPKINLKMKEKLKSIRKTTLFKKKSIGRVTTSRKGPLKSPDKSNTKIQWEISDRDNFYFSDYEKEEKPALTLLNSVVQRLTKNVLIFKNHCDFRSNFVIDIYKDPNKKSNVLVSSSTLAGPKKLSPDNSVQSTVEINKLALEWSVAMENETHRLVNRIDFITKKACLDLKEDCEIIENFFKEFKNDIDYLYHRQIMNIDKVCDLMRAAIEEESKIQPLVLLKNETLEVDGSVILYPVPPPPPPSSLHEDYDEFKFTITQLTNFYNKMVYVAPFGIVEQSFVRILEDMAVMGHETGHCFLPKVWSTFKTRQIKKIVSILFGERAIIDWRLFIIFSLDLGYPTIENILDLKRNFGLLDINRTENVTYEQYSCVYLWFEDRETLSIEQDLYYAKAKDLLFRIFQVDENLINYTELLLTFCRDLNQREGFVKALALAEGCATVAFKQDLFRETFQIQRENEKFQVACGVMNVLMAGVFRIVDSVIISEYVEDMEDDELKPFKKTASLKRTISPTDLLKSQDKFKKQFHKNKSSSSEYSDEDSLNEENGSFRGLSSRESWRTHVVENRNIRILWKSDVYFSTVFSLLMFDIHQFALNYDEIYQPIDMEEKLKKCFNEYGTGHSMKLCDLIGNTYIGRLFDRYKCFQAIRTSHIIPIIAKPKLNK